MASGSSQNCSPSHLGSAWSCGEEQCFTQPYAAVSYGLMLVSADCYDYQPRMPTSPLFTTCGTQMSVPALRMMLSELAAYF